MRRRGGALTAGGDRLPRRLPRCLPRHLLGRAAEDGLGVGGSAALLYGELDGDFPLRKGWVGGEHWRKEGGRRMEGRKEEEGEQGEAE